MSSGHFVTVLRHIRRLADGSEAARNSDRQLLARYLAYSDEEAFAVIVQRHGGMVWGVCRRLLDDPNDADDVFQAAFLVLLNKARTLGGRESLAGWLQGVAWRLARKAKVQVERRKTKEARAASSTAPCHDRVLWSDLRGVLDEELDGLPEKYRVPLILCYLEGKTYGEAANQLGWPDGTVCGRLARARDLLRRRLTRRGIALGAATLTATSVDPGAAPAAAIASVTRMTRTFLLSQSIGETASTTAIVLARGLLQTMALGKLKMAAMGFALLCACAVSAGWVTQQIGSDRTAPPGPPAQARETQRSAAPDRFTISKKHEVPNLVPEAHKDIYGDPLPPGALARMGSMQFRHTLADIAFSGDGKSLVSAGSDQFVVQWDVNSGNVLRKSLLPIERQAARRLSFDGKTMAVGGTDFIHLYDVMTGTQKRRFEFLGWGGDALAFSGNGRYLACASPASPECVIKIWDLTTGNEHLKLKANLTGGTAIVFEKVGAEIRQRQIALNPNLNLRTVFFSMDGSVLGLRYGQKIMLWDSASGRILGQNISASDGFALSPDGKILALAHSSGAVQLMQVPNLNRLAVLEPRPPFPYRGPLKPKLAFSDDGTYLALGGLQRLVLWDLKTRKEITQLAEREALQIIFAPDGKTLAAAGKSTIRLWDVTTGTRLHSRANHDDRIGYLSISPDGKLLASTESRDSTNQIWDAASGRPLRSIANAPAGHVSASFTADGRLLVTKMLEGSVELLEASSGKMLHRFVDSDLVTGRPPFQILDSHLSKDGKRMAIVSRAYDMQKQEQRHQLTVLDVPTGKPLVRRPLAGRNFSTFAAFTPDGLSMAFSEDGRLAIQETMTGTVRLVIPGDLGYPIRFSNSGDLAVVGLQKTQVKQGPGNRSTWEELGLRIIEVATGEELFHIDGRVRLADFSRDGRTLATASFEALQLWDALTGTELFHLRWPKEFVPEDARMGVSSLALTPDGRAAIVGMPDGTILVWDLGAAAKPIALAPKKRPERDDLKRIWGDMMLEPKNGQAAIHALVAAPDHAVPFLAGLLGPTTVTDRQGVETRRTARAIQALRMIATPEAREVLRKLAGGAPDARETKLARDALDSLVGGR